MERNKGEYDSWASWGWPVSSRNPCCQDQVSLHPGQQLSSPRTAPAQAKAVWATCPKSVWLLPSSGMAVPMGLSV